MNEHYRVGKMSSLRQRRLQEILNLAESKKLTDKKKCIPQLLEFLEDPAAVKEVDQNSMVKNGLPTWDHLINAIHNFLLSEIEKLEKKGLQQQQQEQHIKKICSAFWSLMYHSHKQERMLVSPKDMVSLVIQVLGNPNYQTCHNLYTSVLANYVLSRKFYHARITQEQWEELWKICISLYRKGNENSKHIVNAIGKLVKFGCVHSQLHLEVKRMLPILENIFGRVKTRDEHPLVFALLNSVVEHIGKDCRMLLCDFTERVLGGLDNLQFYEAESYKFLLFALTIHHPKGVPQGKDLAYASNWDRWNGILQSSYVAILKDLNNSTHGFSDVACEVFNQILQMKDLDDASTEESSAIPRDMDSSRGGKRRRLTLDKRTPANLISPSNDEICWGALRITVRLIDKYPTSMNANDIVPYLNVLMILFTKNIPDYQLIANLNTVLAKIEPDFVEMNPEISERFDIYWKKVIEFACRSLSLDAKEQPSRPLLQSLIDLKKFTKFNDVLDSYANDKIPWSSSNALTLASLYESIFLLWNESTQDDFATWSDEKSVERRRELLKWTLKVFCANDNLEDLPLPVSRMSRLMIRLMLKPGYPNLGEHRFFRRRANVERNRRRPTTIVAQTDFDDFLRETEECILALNIDSNLLFAPRGDEAGEQRRSNSNSSTISSQSGKREKIENFGDILYDESLVNFSIEHLESLMENLTKEKRLESLISFATLVGKIATDLKELSMTTVEKDCKLIRLIKESLTSTSELFAETKNFRICNDKPLALISRLKSLLLLYETPYTAPVSEIVVSATPPEMISRLFDLMKSAEERRDNSNDPPTSSSSSCPSYRRDFQEYHFEESRGRPEDAVQIYVAKILSAFYGKPTRRFEMFESQRKVLSKLLETENLVFSSEVHLEMVIQILNETFANPVDGHYPKDVTERLEDFLVDFYEKSHRSEETARYLLKILPKALKLSWYSKKDVGKLMKIVARIREKLEDAHYGPQVSEEYVDFLCEIKTKLNADLRAECRFQVENEQTTTTTTTTTIVIDDILDYLGSPFYCVRLSTLRCLKVLFVEESGSEWQRTFFERMKKVVFRMADEFQEEEKLEEEEDRRVARVSSAVHAFALVARFNGFLQKNALLGMLKVAVKSSLDERLIRKLLSRVNGEDGVKGRSVPRDLAKENLSYLIRHWFTLENILEDFPWFLTGSESRRVFFQDNWKSIVPVFMENRKSDELERLCEENFDRSFSEVIEGCFGEIFSWLLCSGQLETTKKLEGNEGEFAILKPFAALLREKLEDVMLFLVKRLNDKNRFLRMMDLEMDFPVEFPDADLPDYEEEAIRGSFDRLTRSLSAKSSLANYLTEYRPDVAQKVLLDLMRDVYRFDYIGEKVRAFHRYAFFCDFLCRELEENVGKKSLAISAYLIRDISHALLHLIQENVRVLSDVACKYYGIFLRKMLPERSAEIEGTLRLAVKTLTLHNDDADADAVLRFLILEHGTAMRRTVKLLADSFPSDPRFDATRQFCARLKSDEERLTCEKRAFARLKGEIALFLDAINETRLIDNTVKCNLEGIVRLRRELSLSEAQGELEEMYEQLNDIRGSAEDCDSSILHRLIHALIQLTDDEDSEIAAEASKCLAELGPASVTTTILRPKKNEAKETIPPEDALTCKIVLYLLNDLLIESDVNLRKLASNCLHDLSSSTWGEKLSDIEYMKFAMNALGEERLEEGRPGAPPDLLKYLHPFVANRSTTVESRGQKKSRKKKRAVEIDWAKFEDCLREKSRGLWTSLSMNSHSDSIGNLTQGLAGCFVNFHLKDLIPLCESDVRLCRLILPRMIRLLFDVDENRAAEWICRCFNGFFQRFFGTSGQGPTSNAAEETKIESKSENESENRMKNAALKSRRESVRYMIDVVDFLRVQTGSDRWPFDYLCIAKAARYCSAYLTSIFYGELYTNLTLESVNFNMYRSTDVLSKIDYLYEMKPVEGKELQDMLRESHLKIGQLDAIRGCGSSHLEEPSALHRHYFDTNQCHELLLEHDIKLYFGESNTRETIDVMQFCKLDFLLRQYMSWYPEDLEPDQIYEAAWRLSDWSVLDKGEEVPRNAKFQYHRYHALKAFHDRDDVRVLEEISNARNYVISELRNVSFENTTTIYERLSQLQMLRELEETIYAKPDKYEDLLFKWHKRDTINCNEFRYVEQILTQRCMIYQIADNFRSNDLLRNAISDTLLNTARVTSLRGYPQVSTKALATVSNNPILMRESADKVHFEEAHMEWNQNHPDVAKMLLRKVISKKDKSTMDLGLWSKSLRVYGDWVADTRSENPRDIVKDYYEKSIELSNSIEEMSSDDLKNLYESHGSLAKFAEDQYRQVVDYMRSPQYEALMDYVRYSRDAAGSDAALAARNQGTFRAIRVTRKQSSQEAADLSHIPEDREKYLLMSFRNYLKVLCASDDHNSLIYRLIYLLLENKSHGKLIGLLSEALDSLASYKFVFMVPQLVPHLSNIRDEFTDIIHEILKTCAMDHPHHTLPVILALDNLHSDYEFDKRRQPRKKHQEGRIAGAKRLTSELADSGIGRIVKEMQKLSRALIMFANMEIECKPGSTFRIPSKQGISKVKGFESVLIPTMPIDINPRGNYDRIIGIHKYEDSYEVVGGASNPRKIFCIGTDGVCRKQLLKSKDDLRQDAVMQQVFSVMNGLLKGSRESRKRKLNTRTYKVVPLTERSGILEWCEDTLPILKVLTDEKEGLHVKYFPKDLKAADCRNKMRNATRRTYEAKFAIYEECCKRLNPALHYFFTEKFPSPDAWFERRLSYIRSVATTSMVGYVLGLGDRHLANILIDQTTAEVIHIDFDIAFEQGKCLPVPEIIPFRLTREIEVAMGVSGIEGTMRRCCEETIRVFREKRPTITSLFQVLLYDPLYAWTITPAKACEIQGRMKRGLSSLLRIPQPEEDPEETNKSAERTLMRLDLKLQGVDDGLITSVSEQVERLLYQARDPVNLSRMYDGWQPYL